MQYPGEGPGGPPPIFRPKIFLGDRPPFPYLSVWMTGGPPLSQGPALQCIIVFHLNELLLIVTRLVMASSVLNK